MSRTPATTNRQRLQHLRPEVLAVARRQGATNLRIYGSIAKGQSSGMPCGCDGSRNATSVDSQRDAHPGATAVNKDRLYLESNGECLERIKEYAAADEDTFMNSRLMNNSAATSTLRPSPAHEGPAPVIAAVPHGNTDRDIRLLTQPPRSQHCILRSA